MINWGEIEDRAIAFSKRWKNCDGNERQQAQTYEKDFMYVFGVDWHEGLHEYKVRDLEGREGLIDYLLPGKIIIEMKSKGESLIRAYNQCYDYVKCLKPEEYPELLMVSDFEYIQVTNLKTMQTFNKFKISKLSKHIRMLGCLAGYNSEVEFKTDIEVNTDASYKMARLHDALEDYGYKGEDLEQYLVRLLFCLFAEDTGIFEPNQFENYIKDSNEDGSNLSSRIGELFSILNIPEDKRMNNTPKELNRFRYINGGLFAKSLPPAFFNKKMRKILLECCNFDWSYISPAIFGAMFQGVMDKEKRRRMGAHYTSEDNILKLIKPLFLQDLWDEFERIKNSKDKLIKFQDKISTLKFLDPACGCGNFLIITYRELRLLEFEILKMLYDNEQMRMINSICKVSIEQFYGIEYEEFPCKIALVGLILMKHQMDKEVSNYFGMNLIDFPIHESGNIIHGNSLTISWEDVVSKQELSYIIGNPPFAGARIMNQEQKYDMNYVFGSVKGIGNLDYVSAWYFKAAHMMKNTMIKTAFVSTNSISQGEQVPILWKEIINNIGMEIIFAYRTFKWSNDAVDRAAVHCVIIGFCSNNINTKKVLIDEDGNIKFVKNINGYLIDAENIFIESRNKPIDNIPLIGIGNKPIDGGHYLFTKDEKDDFIKKEPKSERYFRKWIGSKEFINRYFRYCLWLGDCSPKELHSMPEVLKRVEEVKKFRLQSKSKVTQKLAETPTSFHVENIPKNNYIVIPRVSSQRRRYIPIGFMDCGILSSDSVHIVSNANLYHFGILTSNVHMAWVRAFGGRLKSDYRYSKDVVYNNFPWPSPTEKQINLIEKAAKNILQVRDLFKSNSLADLYDPLTMPKELLKAHRQLDKEVCKAYGTIWKREEDCVSDLLRIYQYKVNDEYKKVLATNE